MHSDDATAIISLQWVSEAACIDLSPSIKSIWRGKIRPQCWQTQRQLQSSRSMSGMCSAWWLPLANSETQPLSDADKCNSWAAIINIIQCLGVKLNSKHVEIMSNILDVSEKLRKMEHQLQCVHVIVLTPVSFVPVSMLASISGIAALKSRSSACVQYVRVWHKNLTGNKIKQTPSMKTKCLYRFSLQDRWKPCIREFYFCNIILTNYKRTNWYWLKKKKESTNGNRDITICGPWLLSFCSGWLHLVKALGSRLEKRRGDCALLAGGCNSISGGVTKP